MAKLSQTDEQVLDAAIRRLKAMSKVDNLMTAIQQQLVEGFRAQGYRRVKADVPQCRGEIIMRKDIPGKHGILQVIHQDGSIVTRSLRRLIP